MQVFFYGLFMDENVLQKNGIVPNHARIAYLDHYKLAIGQRASLIPARNERAYGIVMSVEDAQIEKLYSEPSVVDYVPEEVVVVADNLHIAAVVYNLPEDQMRGTNPEYAKALLDLARKIGFPAEYLETIEMFSIE